MHLRLIKKELLSYEMQGLLFFTIKYQNNRIIVNELKIKYFNKSRISIVWYLSLWVL